MKNKRRNIILAITILALGIIVAAPASAVGPPSGARLTVGTHGFVGGSATLTDGQTITVEGTGFPANLNKKIVLFQCESDRFVFSGGYSNSATDFRTACVERTPTNDRASTDGNGAFSKEITVTKTFTTSQDNNSINCDTAKFPGFPASAPDRPGACGIFAVEISGSSFTDFRFYAPISFHGPFMCYGKEATRVGHFYDQTINGSHDDDTIVAPYGQNIVNAGIGNDTVCTGGEQDTINGGPGNDILDGGAGNDNISGGDFATGDLSSCSDTNTGTDTVIGAQGGDFLNACDGTGNRLFGQSGGDTLYGGTGSATLNCGTGNEGDTVEDQGGTYTTHSSCTDEA